MATDAKHIFVHGRVQGVGFRYFVQRVATRLGLTGNVRNCPDGTVEIVVEGTSKKIHDFLKEVERGPSHAYVERLEIIDTLSTGSTGAFLIEGW